jgi:DNA-binding CsgD family transcriptional regulator
VQSVKYRLGAALKKTGTSNRAELLTLILSTPSLPSGTD